ncbi:MAG: glutamine--fructose-6-phosphate transaminase (isomerizing) [Candidatus Omnitrophota bacterium]|nr:glutamine--fructose-6-phosphate transaminase (isomerizing) [Candidatus Omnitrophota bacterium]
MCGIVGYIGSRSAIPILVNGLERLEYRGYDSAGIACLNGQRESLFVVKEQGKLARLKEQLQGFDLHSRIGIGHTRWATHGVPSRDNAHPHQDASGRIALVHNGIIENYAVLKKELQRKGVKFHSETDTEVAANLIGHYYKNHSLEEAFRKAVLRLEGFFAFVVLSAEEPEKLIVFRRSNPLCLGIGEGENFIASDVTPLLEYTRRIIYLEDDEYGVVSRDKVVLRSLKTRKTVKRATVHIDWDISQAEKGGYPHFMIKEIHEQPQVLSAAIQKRLNRRGNVYFDTLSPGMDKKLKRIKNIYLVSCGTAYHAGMVGNYMMGKYARLPAEATVSSEFRYEDPILNKDDLVILITQSGETADTLAAMREAKQKGAMTLAVVNVVGSTIARESDAVVYTHAGPEIGVASTKAYTAQLATLAFLTLYLAQLKGTITKKELKRMIAELRKLPAAARKVLKQEAAIEKSARQHYHRRNFLYIGRGYNFPTALEGALKLKEITYAHAHGYAAGEMKHGPIALIDHEQLVICMAPRSRTYEKMLSNIEEIRARDGMIIAIGTEGDKRLEKLADEIFCIPKTEEVFSPILTVLPLQLFAYKIAVFNKRDVDQPRNLAKSVTVE